jgi:hypothetical protein
MRWELASYASAAAILAPCAGGSGPQIDFLTPPGKTSAAHPAVTSGTGAHRLTLWTATNSRHELCLGWVLGSKSAPKQLTCLRRGLERPVLTVQGGGGQGGQITWGELVGLASPLVAKISVEEGVTGSSRRDLELLPLPGFPAWRMFATGPSERPPNKLTALDHSDQTIIEDLGPWIRPQTGSWSSWTGTFGKVPEKRSDERAISIAVADPAVRSILLQHPAWLDSSPGARWGSCSGKPLGHVVSFRFVSPATFTATLPILGRAEGKFAYSESVQKVLATEVRQLNVSVDLNVGQVVGVDARAYDVPLEPGGNIGGVMTQLVTVTPPHDAGGPDAGNCPPPQTTG